MKLNCENEVPWALHQSAIRKEGLFLEYWEKLPRAREKLDHSHQILLKEELNELDRERTLLQE